MTALGWEVVPALIDFDLDAMWTGFMRLRAWSTAERNILNSDLLNNQFVKPETQWEIEQSLKLTIPELADASALRARWCATLESVFREFDFLAAPTTQVMPFDIEVHWPRSIGNRLMDTYHRWMETVVPWTLSGRPVLNVPAGFDDRGLPTGIQIIGNHWRESELLVAANEYLSTTNWIEANPPPLRPSNHHSHHQSQK
jgi:amidase